MIKQKNRTDQLGPIFAFYKVTELFKVMELPKVMKLPNASKRITTLLKRFL